MHQVRGGGGSQCTTPNTQKITSAGSGHRSDETVEGDPFHLWLPSLETRLPLRVTDRPIHAAGAVILSISV
jgi:hypothetical protein